MRLSSPLPSRPRWTPGSPAPAPPSPDRDRPAGRGRAVGGHDRRHRRPLRRRQVDHLPPLGVTRRRARRGDRELRTRPRAARPGARRSSTACGCWSSQVGRRSPIPSGRASPRAADAQVTTRPASPISRNVSATARTRRWRRSSRRASPKESCRPTSTSSRSGTAVRSAGVRPSHRPPTGHRRPGAADRRRLPAVEQHRTGVAARLQPRASDARSSRPSGVTGSPYRSAIEAAELTRQPATAHR